MRSSPPSLVRPSFALARAVLGIAVFLITALAASAHGIAEEDLSKFIEGGPVVYLELGARHMLTGYDHLLFLFGVIFFVTRLKEIVVLISAFTAGHSLTLILATFLQIQANAFLIDATIALTVCYKAFDNLDGFRRFIGTASPNLLGAVFVFGLIHGFGLSTRLQALPLGHQSLLPRILSFNLGVEVGQIGALMLLVAVLALWRRRPSFAKFAHVANAALLLAGALLFLAQLHGYVHSAHPEDFIDEHLLEHLHEESAKAGESETSL